MKGDFTRLTFKRSKNYNGVLLQQGRVLLDADWNEQALSELDQQQGLARSAFGQSAAEGQAFEIRAHEQLDDWQAIEGWRGYAAGLGNLWNPRVVIDHTRALDGRSSLRVTGATRIVKRLKTPIFLAGRKYLYFAHFGDSAGLAQATFSLYGKNNMSAPLCELPLYPYQRVKTDQGVWVKYRCLTENAFVKFGKKGGPIIGFGISNLSPQIKYYFDSFEMDYASRLPNMITLPGNSLNPGRWGLEGGGQPVVKPALNSALFYRGQRALQLASGKKWQQSFAGLQDFRQVESLIFSVQAPKGVKLDFHLSLAGKNPIALNAISIGEEGGWTQYSASLEKLEPGDLEHVKGVIIGTGKDKGPINIGEIQGVIQQEGNFYILGGDRNGDALRFYLDGILSQREKTETYLTQVQQPAVHAIAPLDQNKGRLDLVYLDVWQRHVTCLEDPGLLEPALGGADTTTRLETVAQVKIISGEIVDALSKNNFALVDRTLIESKKPVLLSQLAALPRKGSGQLTVDQQTYQGVDNCLYRVEVHTGGELGKAAFKWSKDNGIQAAGLSDPFGPQDPQARVNSLGRSPADRFKNGDLLEISDDWTDYSGLAGDLLRINGEIDTDQNLLPIQPLKLNSSGVLEETTLSRSYAPEHHARVRRWDGVLITDGKCKLGDDGIQVEFNAGPFQAGDYWTFAARTATQKPDELALEPPQGIEHHFCPLALVTWQLDENRQLCAADLVDLRPVMDALTELEADDIHFSDGDFLGQAANVQAALEVLSNVVLAGDHNCTIVVRSEDELIDALSRAELNNGGTIYFPAGTYVFTKGIPIYNRYDLTIEGSGATHLVFLGDSWLFDINDSKRIQFRDINLFSFGNGNLFSVRSTNTLQAHNCLFYQGPRSDISIVNLAAGNIYLDDPAAIHLVDAVGFSLSHCQVVGMNGIEMCGEKVSQNLSEISLSDCSIFALAAGIGENPNTNARINLTNSFVVGWTKEMISAFLEMRSGFNNHLNDTNYWGQNVVSILDLSVIAEKPEMESPASTCIALAGRCDFLEIRGGYYSGLLVLYADSVEKIIFSDVQFLGQRSTFSVIAVHLSHFSINDCIFNQTIHMLTLDDGFIDNCVIDGEPGFQVGVVDGSPVPWNSVAPQFVPNLYRYQVNDDLMYAHDLIVTNSSVRSFCVLGSQTSNSGLQFHHDFFPSDLTTAKQYCLCIEGPTTSYSYPKPPAHPRRIENCEFVVFVGGILSHAEGMEIHNNIFHIARDANIPYPDPANDGTAICLFNGHCSITNNQISCNNNASAASWGFIFIAGKQVGDTGNPLDDIVIRENEIIGDRKNPGINLWGHLAGVSILGNTIRHCGPGIYVAAAENLEIIGNHVILDQDDIALLLPGFNSDVSDHDNATARIERNVLVSSRPVVKVGKTSPAGGSPGGGGSGGGPMNTMYANTAFIQNQVTVLYESNMDNGPTVSLVGKNIYVRDNEINDQNANCTNNYSIQLAVGRGVGTFLITGNIHYAQLLDYSKVANVKLLGQDHNYSLA